MRQRVIRLGPRGGRVVREHLGPDGRMRYEYDRPGGPAPTRQAAPEPLIKVVLRDMARHKGADWPLIQAIRDTRKERR